jgi:branched-chain amino acid transport system ATP-binding protein
MMAGPELLMLDEPSLGLAPIIVEDVFSLVESLAAEGQTVLLVEQNVAEALTFGHRAYVLEQGHIVMEGTGQELLGNAQLQQAYLGA